MIKCDCIDSDGAKMVAECYDVLIAIGVDAEL